MNGPGERVNMQIVIVSRYSQEIVAQMRQTHTCMKEYKCR